MEVNGTLLECRKSDSEPVLFRFLILDAPSPSSLPAYVKELQRHKVSHLVRVCGPTYKSEIVEKAGISVHGWSFDDGAPPPQNVIDNWLGLLDSEVGRENGPATIAVHCVAGLGRAPILVAVAFVEFAAHAALDAVGYIRERRKGAINQVQLNWLMRYKARKQSGSGNKFACCPTM
jgi:protein tyrosine phosphatase type 4A